MLAQFTKMHGCGNDFVLFDERSRPLGLSAARAAALADRRTGIGYDQLITLERAPGADAFMRIRNPDGSEAGACGNATRCVADYLGRQTGRQRLLIRTVAGDLISEINPDGRVRVDMGAPRLAWNEIPLAQPMDSLHLDLTLGSVSDPAAASMGNPHVTFFVSELASLPIAQLGPALEHHPLFPDRANIGFAQILTPGQIRLRVWERGAGLTRACGSGACAALVNAHRRGLAGPSATVILDGGELEIAWQERRVFMTGPVATAYTGTIDLSAYPE
ncbi:MAG: diaminopimelate epimerase [Acetobacteraceae bacterium]|nr:diaminopimelate epimerase [Acetobacteraceae bacterium]